MPDGDYFDVSIAITASNPVSIVPNATFQAFLVNDPTFSTPKRTFDASSGVEINPLVSSNIGTFPQIKVEGDPTEIILKSGSYTTRVTSVLGRQGPAGPSAYDQVVAKGHDVGTEDEFIEALAVVPKQGVGWHVDGTGHLIVTLADGTTVDAGVVQGPPGPNVDPSQSTAGQVYTSTGPGSDPQWQNAVAGILGAPSQWPSTFPPSDHAQLVTTLRNGSNPLAAAIMSLLTAADQQAARAAIGAGTGNGTSNLGLGATATTAMPGNRVFDATEVTAAANPTAGLAAGTVASQLAQAAAMGGGGGSNVLVVRFASGAYPAVPTTKPAGIDLVEFYGPTQPTIVPAWIGNGAGQVLGNYYPRDLT